MFYYALSAFILSTFIFMMQGQEILTINWLACIVIGTFILKLLDEVFLDANDVDDF